MARRETVTAEEALRIATLLNTAARQQGVSGELAIMAIDLAAWVVSVLGTDPPPWLRVNTDPEQEGARESAWHRISDDLGRCVREVSSFEAMQLAAELLRAVDRGRAADLGRPQRGGVRR